MRCVPIHSDSEGGCQEVDLFNCASPFLYMVGPPTDDGFSHRSWTRSNMVGTSPRGHGPPFGTLLESDRKG